MRVRHGVWIETVSAEDCGLIVHESRFCTLDELCVKYLVEFLGSLGMYSAARSAPFRGRDATADYVTRTAVYECGFYEATTGIYFRILRFWCSVMCDTRCSLSNIIKYQFALTVSGYVTTRQRYVTA